MGSGLTLLGNLKQTPLGSLFTPYSLRDTEASGEQHGDIILESGHTRLTPIGYVTLNLGSQV